MDNNYSHLSKKDRKKLNQQVQKETYEKEEQRKKLFKWGTGIGIIVLFALGLWWLVSISSEPTPGQLLPDLGREHVQDISGITYNSNPPTSGSHFPIWAQRGVYNEILSDGYLIHSLEHGYIVIYYNCGPKAPSVTSLTYKKGAPLTQFKLAPSGAMSPFQPNTKPPQQIPLRKDFFSSECKNLVTNLSPFLDQFHRVVIVPRSNLDSEIALTAWRRLEKLNSFDQQKIHDFIAAYEDK